MAVVFFFWSSNPPCTRRLCTVIAEAAFHPRSDCFRRTPFGQVRGDRRMNFHGSSFGYTSKAPKPGRARTRRVYTSRILSQTDHDDTSMQACLPTASSCHHIPRNPHPSSRAQRKRKRSVRRAGIQIGLHRIEISLAALDTGAITIGGGHRKIIANRAAAINVHVVVHNVALRIQGSLKSDDGAGVAVLVQLDAVAVGRVRGAGRGARCQAGLRAGAGAERRYRDGVEGVGAVVDDGGAADGGGCGGESRRGQEDESACGEHGGVRRRCVGISVGRPNG
ncbi:uncharacterized protein BKA78DRAFT_321289 [Phyllosticta capitalensis]|uniref:uncharacterized protein n=1 Tax=Phyllosticta capitalensis TaxID=121624 RepID=UPI00312D69E9